MHGKIQKNYKSRAIHRLKIIEGQIRGLKKLVEEEEYCIDILNQSISVQESIKSFNALILENHLKTHVPHQLKSRDKEKSIKELVRLYKLTHK